MKEQLTKFKTQFDLHANYNQKALLEAKKTIYEPEIALSDRIDTSTQQNFTLKPLQIGFIQSLTLKDDPKFKEIQKIFSKYNSEVISMPVNPAAGLHLKKVVMDSMLKFLRMMMLAPDAITKKTILDISYYWFIKHLNPKSQRKPQVVMLKQIKKIVTQNNLLPRNIVEKELPSQKLKEELQFYQIKARTEHPDLDAPQHQLQNYHIHKVGYINEKIVKVENQVELRRKKLARMKFIRPNLEQYYLPPPEEGQKQAQKSQLLRQNPPPATGEQAQLQDPNQPPPPEQPTMNAEMMKQMQLLNQMGGQPQQPQQPPVEQEEEKKRGKLDPLVKVFLKKQFEQKSKQSQLPQTSISNIQRYRNNYKQILHRQDEIFSRGMNEWASKKARVKTQAARRIQSIRMNHTQIVENTTSRPFQQAFYQTRVNQVVRQGRSYIKGDLIRQKLNTQASLSCFDRRRIKTVACSANKPFSEIIEENKRMNMRQQALDQISYIKQKFAKQKIFASLQAMKKGLMHHEEQKEDQQLKVEYPTNLMSNPFFVVKKKKKKGKKKK